MVICSDSLTLHTVPATAPTANDGGRSRRGPRPPNEAATIRELRAKAALYDELVEEFARAEDELDRVRAAARAPRSAAVGIDPAWREIANDLAEALRPYGCFGSQSVEEGRIVVHTRVPGATLSKARRALDRLGDQVALESHRKARMAPGWRERDERAA